MLRRCDRKPRYYDAFDGGLSLIGLGPALRAGAKIDNEANHRTRLVGEADDADTTHFNEASQTVGGPHQQPPARCLEMHAVIADKSGEWQDAGASGGDQREGQPRLPRTGRTADQNRPRAGKDRGSVNRCGHVAGRRTMKRAPATFGSMSGAVATASLFSTQMAPPWASTICLEMESPRPEF